jgi:integrase
MASAFQRTRWFAKSGTGWRRVGESAVETLRAAGEVVEKRHEPVWRVSYLDETGRSRTIGTKARTKTEAIRLGSDLERRAERVREGLEVALPKDGGGALSSLLKWWLEAYSAPALSHDRNEAVIRAHLLDSDLGRFPLAQVTAPKIEAYLQEKSAEGLGPQSLNHLRGFLSRAFSAARKVGRYPGSNPVVDVTRRRVPKRKPDYLRAHEVVPVMDALDERWRPLFATAIFTGLRKGELGGLRKCDVDLDGAQLTVARSWGNDTTKSGKFRVLPLASEVAPYVKAAIEASPSKLVFPKPDGSMMSGQVALEDVLRRALARAGIVEGYEHTCRAKGCEHVEAAPDNTLRRCPVHGHKLWPKSVVRPIRFHDLRHTTASLMLMAGASLAAVGKILGHANTRITAEIYGHLAPDDLKGEVDRLSFGLPAPASAQVIEVAVVQVTGNETVPSCAYSLPTTTAQKGEAGTPSVSRGIPASFVAGCTGLEPVASGVTGRRYNQLN